MGQHEGRHERTPDAFARAASLAGSLRRQLATPRGLGWSAFVVALAIALVTGGVVLDRYLASMESYLAALGPLGLVAFVLVYTVATSVLVPDTPFRLAAGAVFGVGWGVLVVAAGTLFGSMLQFALARPLRPRIARVIARRATLAAIRDAVLRDGLRLQFLIRLTPLNHASVTYALGAAGVRFAPFLAALPALLPAVVIEVYVGYAARHAAHLVGRGSGSVVGTSDLLPFATLALGVVATVLVSRAAHRAVQRATERVCG